MKQKSGNKCWLDCERGEQRGLRVLVLPSRGAALNCCYWLLLVLHIAAGVLVLLALLSPYPLRPSCLIEWKTKLRTCAEARSALIQRLADWGAAFRTCGDCSHYEVLSAEPSSIFLWHRSRWHDTAYEADINILFTPTNDGLCDILAQSSARGWLWPLDGGASYCVLASLAADSSFLGPLASQRTDDPVCTQFSSATCPRLTVPQEPRDHYDTLPEEMTTDLPYVPPGPSGNLTQNPQAG